MPADEYDRMLASQVVADMIEKQKRLFKEYGVISTPSVYVNSRYRIDNQDIEGAFRKSYVDAVTSLLGGTGK